MPDQDCFVLWPDPDDDQWIDTHQGGLFAWLIYRAIGAPLRAQVDVTAHLHIPGQRMPLGTGLSAQLWAPPVIGKTDARAKSATPWTTPLMAAIYLGSTPGTWLSRITGEPFQVTRDRLTQTGDAVAHCLDMDLGFDGDLLTFTGDPQRHRRWRWQV